MSFRNFPYTNYHDLNADWLLETVKKDAESNAQLKATTDALQKRVETDLNSQNTKINDLQRTTTAKLNAQDAKIAENNASEVQLINNWGTNLRQETTEKIDTWGNNLDNHITQVGEDNTTLINQWGESVPTYVNSYLNDYKESGELSDAIVASIANLGYANIFTYRNIGFIVPDRWNIDIIKNALISGRVNNFAGKSIFSGFVTSDLSAIDSGATDIVIMTNLPFLINDISKITDYFTWVKDSFPDATIHMVSPFVDDNIQYEYKEFRSLMMWKICQKCDVCYMDITFNNIFTHTNGFFNSNSQTIVDNRMLSELIISKVVTYANDRPGFKPVEYSASNLNLLNTFGIELKNITLSTEENFTIKVYNDGVSILSGRNEPFIPSSDYSNMAINCKSIYELNNSVLVTGYRNLNDYLCYVLIKNGNNYNFTQYSNAMEAPASFSLNLKIDI